MTSADQLPASLGHQEGNKPGSSQNTGRHEMSLDEAKKRIGCAVVIILILMLAAVVFDSDDDDDNAVDATDSNVSSEDVTSSPTATSTPTLGQIKEAHRTDLDAVEGNYEGDVVAVWGTVSGTLSGQNAFGGSISQPRIDADDHREGTK